MIKENIEIWDVTEAGHADRCPRMHACRKTLHKP